VTELACRDNELGYMFYHNLGGSISDNLTGNQTIGNVTLTNIQFSYWSGTDFGVVTSLAPFFRFSDGGQSAEPNFVSRYGWAVRPGDVPVPAAVWLFGSGLLGLIGISRRKKTS